MLRLRSLGRSLGRSLRRVFSRSSHALVSLGRDRARIGRTIEPRIVRPFRPLVRPLIRPLRGPLGGLAGFMPALLVGAGVFLVVAGLFNYFSPAGQPGASPTSEVASGSPSLLSFPSLATPSGSVNPSPDTSGVVSRAVATRVVIPVLLIDLPIVASPLNEKFPLCDAAEYLSLDKVVYGYPGAPQAVYLYAHARVHMFWQLLAKSRVNDGAALFGASVEVYTDDNQLHIYEIREVIRHVPDSPRALDKPLAAATDQLWLQTSEGYANSSLKLQVVAMPIGVVAASQADAHPAGRGNVCPDAPLCTAAGQGGCRR